MRLLLFTITISIIAAALVITGASGPRSTATAPGDRSVNEAQPNEEAAPAIGEVRFMEVQVRIDPKGQPLAAYQFELLAEPAWAMITGIENGEHAAFADVPARHDAKALNRHGRIIVAAFNTADADALPHEETLVTTLHMAVPADREPEFKVKLQAVADHTGNPIDAEITATPAKTTPDDERTSDE